MRPPQVTRSLACFVGTYGSKGNLFSTHTDEMDMIHPLQRKQIGFTTQSGAMIDIAFLEYIYTCNTYPQKMYTNMKTKKLLRSYW